MGNTESMRFALLVIFLTVFVSSKINGYSDQYWEEWSSGESESDQHKSVQTNSQVTLYKFMKHCPVGFIYISLPKTEATIEHYFETLEKTTGPYGKLRNLPCFRTMQLPKRVFGNTCLNSGLVYYDRSFRKHFCI